MSDVERLGDALGARLTLRLDWNGEALDRLLDGEHAQLVELLVGRLRDAGWEVATEVTFAIGGERGSIDVLGFHRATRILLVVEAKTVIPDVQSMLATLDRKARLGMAIARQQGWDPVAVGRLLVVSESRTSRRRVETLAETFRQQFPDRVASVRAWIARPEAARPLRGLWFLADRPATGRHRVSSSPAVERATGIERATGVERSRIPRQKSRP